MVLVSNQLMGGEGAKLLMLFYLTSSYAKKIIHDLIIAAIIINALDESVLSHLQTAHHI